MLSIARMQSMLLLRGWGHPPPENFLKLHALRLNLRAYFRMYIAIGIILTLAVYAHIIASI